jgi:hypothetical protein
MCRDTPDTLITNVTIEAPMALPDGSGGFYVDAGGFNQIARAFANGTFEYVVHPDTFQGFAGDGGPANSALVSSPASLAIDGAGDLYIVDTNNDRIRKIWVHGYPGP